MIIQLLILVAGLLLILFGANFLVDGSSSVARRSGISEFVIGLTIVGIGTSTPEMVVSFLAAAKGNADMAVGNIVGSNIFNTFLILGVTAIISPLIITRSNLKRDIPMNIISSLLLVLLGMNQLIFGMGDNTLSRIDGGILLALFAFYMYISFRHNVPDEEGEARQMSVGMSVLFIVGGLAALIAGGRLFVNSASELARIFGVSDAFIAITVMAGGTSLPELATCIVAAAKGRGQLALGNILGSNISNILLILGGSALISPLAIKGITPYDFGVMLLGSILILASAYLFSKRKLDRVEGVIFLLCEAGYMAYLIMNI